MSLTDQLAKCRIVLAANIVDGYPSEFEYTKEFLLSNGVGQLTTISHPLQRRSSSRSRIVRYEEGKESRNISVPRPNIPPMTHVLDYATGLLPIKSDIWIGFNPIMTAMGALVPQSKVLANWAIDFVPNRGEIGIAEKFYRKTERFMMNHLDAQIENSQAALEARIEATGIKPNCQLLAPIGVWKDSFSAPVRTRHEQRRIVYFGSLDQRNGAPFLAELLAVLLQLDSDVIVDVIGEGDSSEAFLDLSKRFPQQICYHGYIEKQLEIDLILRQCVVALAPYDETPGSFTKFADPQKLKYYAANGLPVILTNVAPSAIVMEKCGAAILLSQSDGFGIWVAAIEELLNDYEAWQKSASNSYTYALQFERNNVYTETFGALLSLLEIK